MLRACRTRWRCSPARSASRPSRVVIYAGFAGAQEATANLAPTVIYVLFWVGFPFASVLFGDVFRAVNPWLAVGKAAGWVARRLGGESAPEPLAYPEWLGRWPAVARRADLRVGRAGVRQQGRPVAAGDAWRWPTPRSSSSA